MNPARTNTPSKTPSNTPWNRPSTLVRDEAGVVGKAAVIWLLFAAVLVVAMLDIVSIGRSTFRLSEVATEAASDGAAAYRSGRDEVRACQAVTESIEAEAPDLKLGRNGCHVDAETGRVTVTLRTTADTIVAGRFGPTRPYTRIIVIEANGPANI